MSQETPKLARRMLNETLRQKFKAHDRVTVPNAIIYRFTGKLVPLPPQVLGTVALAGNAMIGKHWRFAVEIKLDQGPRGITVWEEWMLEKIMVVLC